MTKIFFITKSNKKKFNLRKRNVFFFTFFCNDKLIQTAMTKETNALDYHQSLGDCLGYRGLSCVALWSPEHNANVTSTQGLELL